MKWALASIVALWSTATVASTERVQLPSGLSGYLQEVIAQESAGLYRFRFVAEAFSKDAGLASVTADLEHLCAQIALPKVPEGGRIVVSLADQPSEFGVAAPQVTQVFEAFRVENSRCIWEEF